VPSLQASKGLSFGLRGPRKKKATYRKREGNEQYTLARFDPVLLDVMEDALAGKLNQEEYPYARCVTRSPGVVPALWRFPLALGYTVLCEVFSAVVRTGATAVVQLALLGAEQGASVMLHVIMCLHS
jgi:hypothetical protein